MAKKGLFKALFGRKEGGSVVGNLLRGVGDKLTGGAYSTVFQPGARGLFGKNKVGGSAAPSAPQNTGIAGNFLTQSLVDASAEKPSLMQTIKKNWAYVAGGIAAVVAVWYYILKPKKSGYKRR